MSEIWINKTNRIQTIGYSDTGAIALSFNNDGHAGVEFVHKVTLNKEESLELAKNILERYDIRRIIPNGIRLE